MRSTIQLAIEHAFVAWRGPVFGAVNGADREPMAAQGAFDDFIPPHPAEEAVFVDLVFKLVPIGFTKLTLNFHRIARTIPAAAKKHDTTATTQIEPAFSMEEFPSYFYLKPSPCSYCAFRK